MSEPSNGESPVGTPHGESRPRASSRAGRHSHAAQSRSSRSTRSQGAAGKIAGAWSLRVVVALGVAVFLTVVIGWRLQHFTDEQPSDAVAVQSRTSNAAVTKPAHTATPVITPAPTPDPAAVAAAAAATAITTATSAVATIMAANPGIDVSIAAVNVTTGATFTYGSAKGMVMGSIVKLDILESALIQAQNSGRGLTSSQKNYAVPMIEQSDNGAADSLFRSIGGNRALSSANTQMGLSTTVLDSSGQWGLSTTSAADQILLLKQLTTGTVLSAASKAYALGLMGQVEADQRWGVGAAADPNTSFVNKNGWLNVDDDNDLWLVNSNGIITVKGQQVMLSVLTQHNKSFNPGVALVNALAVAAAPSVAS